MKTRFYKNVRWLEPFFAKTKGLLPLHKVELVMGFQVPLDRCEIINGRCLKDDQGRCTITLRIMNQVWRVNMNSTFTGVKHTRRSIYSILCDFAHELAHVKHWDHTPEHWELECRITRRFISELKRREITNVDNWRRPK